MFSLRKWGCCSDEVTLDPVEAVFPTQVGVLPIDPLGVWIFGSFPYASGGVARHRIDEREMYLFSLRKWGCCWNVHWTPYLRFVFPTQVGVLAKPKVLEAKTKKV